MRKYRNFKNVFFSSNLFSNGIKESSVVTKVFDVKIAPPDHVQSDEYENRYLYELQQERKVMKMNFKSNSFIFDLIDLFFNRN